MQMRFGGPCWAFFGRFLVNFLVLSTRKNRVIYNVFVPLASKKNSVGAGAVADRLGAATLRRCEFRLLLRVVAWSRLTLRRCEFGRRLRVVASDAATL